MRARPDGAAACTPIWLRRCRRNFNAGDAFCLLYGVAIVGYPPFGYCSTGWPSDPACREHREHVDSICNIHGILASPHPAMPRPTARQSVLRFPVTSLLGGEANVRVLRELVRHGAELSAPTIAKRAGLSRQHALRVVNGLAEAGAVERVGVGGHPSYRIRRGHPLHAGLEAIFRAEEERFRAVEDAIRSAASGAEAVWLYGSVARGDDSAGSVVDVAVVIDAPDVEDVVDGIRARLREREDALGISVSVVGIGPADVVRLSGGDPWWSSLVHEAIPLAGPDPERLSARIRRAQRIEQRIRGGDDENGPIQESG
jgi:predicted nucleotidyltransferase